MRKLLFTLLLCLTASASGQFQQKPMLGEQIDWSHPLSKGLVGWLLNEGSGNKVFDLSGNGNGLTLSGSWASGGPKIDASTDRLLADGSVLSQTEGTFICCLNRFAAFSQFGAVFNVETGANDSPHEMILFSTINALNDPQKFWPNVDQSSGDYWEFGLAATIFPLNTDVVIAVTWKNGVSLKGYLDGIESGTLNGDASWTASAFSAGEQLSIGNTYGVNYETNCIYKWAYAYNRVLSASEIALLYREPFCMFKRDDVAIMAKAAEAPTGGQVIFIQSMIPLFLIPVLILIKRRKCRQR